MILLLQFRSDASGPHEIKCVYEAGSLPFSEYRILNATDESLTASEIQENAEGARAIILGGLGETGYEETDPEKLAHFQAMRNKLASALAPLIKTNKPMFGMCFGHQLLADLLGGTVEVRKNLAETGIADINLTVAGQADPLFVGLPHNFKAVVGHKCSVTSLPETAVVLARTERCPIQAFRFGNIVGTQFHPEMNYDDLIYRLGLYPEYAANSLEYDENPDIQAKKITENFLLHIKK